MNRWHCSLSNIASVASRVPGSLYGCLTQVASLSRTRTLLRCWGAKLLARTPMILDRLYDPPGDELIYHYCRPEAFLEIARHQVIWLSAYYVLNDALEREWGYSIFAKV